MALCWANLRAVAGTTGDAAADVAASAASTRTINTFRNMSGVSGETRAVPVYSFRLSCEVSSRVRVSLIIGHGLAGKSFPDSKMFRGRCRDRVLPVQHPEVAHGAGPDAWAKEFGGLVRVEGIPGQAVPVRTKFTPQHRLSGVTIPGKRASIPVRTVFDRPCYVSQVATGRRSP